MASGILIDFMVVIYVTNESNLRYLYNDKYNMPTLGTHLRVLIRVLFFV